MTDGRGISCKIALRWMPLNLIDDRPTLVQVMAWYRQATSHYLNQCWPRSPAPDGVTRAYELLDQNQHISWYQLHAMNATGIELVLISYPISYIYESKQYLNFVGFVQASFSLHYRVSKQAMAIMIYKCHFKVLIWFWTYLLVYSIISNSFLTILWCTSYIIAYNWPPWMTI